jgi:hypothetical protein
MHCPVPLIARFGRDIHNLSQDTWNGPYRDIRIYQAASHGNGKRRSWMAYTRMEQQAVMELL